MNLALGPVLSHNGSPLSFLWQTGLSVSLLLQEEVMEFEMKDLEILDNQNGQNRRERPEDLTPSVPNSIILNELHKENEELQNKLKLNYRRLLLFETENNKLIEEKNKLFFETQNYFQKNQLLTEKNEELEKLNILAEHNQKLMAEKVDSLEKINRTQLIEIKRFVKFHTKIQDVVKPFILQLKKQVAELSAQLTDAQKANSNMTATYREFCKKIELETQAKDTQILTLNTEKNALTQSYEEQIHSFSKEILQLQGRNEDYLKEISRLKKSVEFKNYFENEVIRFKRTHEEDQVQIQDLTQKKAKAEARVLALETSEMEAKSILNSCKNHIQDMETSLEATRSQLSKKIDELGTVFERLARLEKLNNQLSQELNEMNSKQN